MTPQDREIIASHIGRNALCWKGRECTQNSTWQNSPIDIFLIKYSAEKYRPILQKHKLLNNPLGKKHIKCFFS